MGYPHSLFSCKTFKLHYHNAPSPLDRQYRNPHPPVKGFRHDAFLRSFITVRFCETRFTAVYRINLHSVSIVLCVCGGGGIGIQSNQKRDVACIICQVDRVRGEYEIRVRLQLDTTYAVVDGVGSLCTDISTSICTCLSFSVTSFFLSNFLVRSY